MPELDNFNPDWLSSPGDTIADILEEQRLSPEEFARRMGRTRDYAMSLIRGNRTIDEQTARLLSSALGASEKFWVSREQEYRAALAEREAAMDPSLHTRWLSTVPVSEMKSYGWLQTTAASSSDALECLRFFGVPTIEAWNASVSEMLNAASLRTSRTFHSEPGAIAAWLRQGELEAAAIDCDKWNPKKFRATLNEIRKLTREDDPKVFLPELRKRCAACGVAVVVLRAPKTCKASGACR